MWPGIALAIALTGCGRIAFDERLDADVVVAVDDSGNGDGPALVCPAITCSGRDFNVICNGRCIAFCADTVQFPDAIQRCQTWGGSLISMREQADQDCVVSRNAYGWLGYQQDASAQTPQEGWRWLDGTPTAYTKWAGGEPNDGDDLENSDETCAHVYGDGVGDWNDRGCPSSTPQAILCSR